jgi:copper chaperone
MNETTLRVEGMTCQGCVRSVTNALQHVPGVSKAQVSLERNEAAVLFDEAKTNVAALKAAVEAAGFGAS